MKQIMVYGDSLSWGIVPGSRNRLPFSDRWPGVMEIQLQRQGEDVRVVEDCLNGRTTVWDDPYKRGRNGLDGLEQRIELNSPIALVMVMLGTNDFQATQARSAWQSAQGLLALVNAVRRAPIEPVIPRPKIMLIAPPSLGTPRGEIAPKFLDAGPRSVGFSAAIERVASDAECEFFDAGDVVNTSSVDGVHLDKDQHRVLGVSISERVKDILIGTRAEDELACDESLEE